MLEVKTHWSLVGIAVQKWTEGSEVVASPVSEAFARLRYH